MEATLSFSHSGARAAKYHFLSLRNHRHIIFLLYISFPFRRYFSFRTLAVKMSPATPPTADLSRPKLKQLSAWIRNDLDAMIAQEGPEKLQADDVLTLHEAFYALRTSNSITALDLRATGIHRAVLEVAGTATRWPRRLVDDCDKIIAVWTSKFGRLQDLHPFMYGRGGRLEGIASIDEFSRGVRRCPSSPVDSRAHILHIGSPQTVAGYMPGQNVSKTVPQTW